MKIFLNGQFVSREDAKVSVFDHGFLYGDGVFEGLRAYNGKIFRLTEHIERLFISARAILLEIPYTKEEVADICNETVLKNEFTDCYLRLVISRGVGDLGLDPRLCKEAGVVVIADKLNLYPAEMYENGMSIITSVTPRIASEALNPKIKSLNYLNNIMAKMEGLEHNVPEVLMLNSQGYVSEASADNIFIVKDGVLLTPPESAGILLGVTREAVIEISGEMGIKCLEQDMNRFDIYTSDECFLTGTAAEIISVTTLDGRKVGAGKPGPMTKKLLARFREITLN